MTRNLLKDSHTLYQWVSSDAKANVDMTTPGIAFNKNSAYTNAYFWVGNDTQPVYHKMACKLNDVVQLYDTLTLSFDVKITGDSSKISARFDVRYSNSEGKVVTDWIDEGTTNMGKSLAGMTDWTRVSLPVKTTKTGKNGTGALFCVFFDAGCTAGTTVEWRNMKLEVGDTGSDWTPAPEEVLFESLTLADLEQGAISNGMTGYSYEAAKFNDDTWGPLRVRSKELIPLLGRTAFTVYIPDGFELAPVYFGADGKMLDNGTLTVGSGLTTYIVLSGAEYVALCFFKPDNSAITPTDVTNVTGGWYSLMAIKARQSIQLEDFSGELSDLDDKTIANATALEQRLSTQILQTQEQIQQTVTEQYYTKDQTQELVQQLSTAFTQTSEGWQMDFQKILATVNANKEESDSEFQEWSKYIRFVDGNIILGQVQNPIILTIKNDRISFSQSGQEVAYLSNSELVITDARVTHSLTIGDFAWVPRANGSLDLKKVSTT